MNLPYNTTFAGDITGNGNVMIDANTYNLIFTDTLSLVGNINIE